MAAVTPILELFAGIGTLGEGVKLACRNARVCGYVEVGIEVAEILARRIEEGTFPFAPIWSDVRTFPSGKYRGRMAGVVAGFPCPDYSVAGKRAGILGRHGQLWDDLACVIRDVGPDWVYLENVSGILVSHGSDAGEGTLPAGLWFVLGDLAQMGFHAEWGSIRVSGVGGSHGRLRWFCLAYRKSGGCGELRESSGSERFTDGRQFGMDHTSRNGEPGRERESGGSGWRRVCETGERMDDSADAIGRTLGERVCSSREGIDAGGEGYGGSGITDGALAHPESPEWRTEPNQHGDTYRGPGPRRSGSELGNPNEPGLQRRNERGSECGGEWAARPPERELADTERFASGPEQFYDAGKWPGSKTVDRSVFAECGGYGHCGNGPGLFAPGPSDPRWPGIIAGTPWLAPALSEEEIERILRGMAAGTATELEFEHRTDRLRALGNMAQPLQAAVAFVVLARRAGLDYLLAEEYCVDERIHSKSKFPMEGT